MEATDSDFNEKAIEASKEKLIVVDFWAAWCVPCNMLAPAVESAVNAFEDAELVKVNVDESPKVSGEYEINAIPAVKLFKDGKVVDEFTGVRPEADIKEIIKKNI